MRESFEWFFQNPDCYLYKISLLDKRLLACLWISFLMILEIKGSSNIGLLFEGLVLDLFLNKGFNFTRVSKTS